MSIHNRQGLLTNSEWSLFKGRGRIPLPFLFGAPGRAPIPGDESRLRTLMKNVLAYLVSILGILLLPLGCGDSKGGPIWTVMVYMAGDNNLSSSMLQDLDEMEVIGSTDNVNVVVQIDTLTGTTKRLLVKRGESTLLEDLGEENMADPATLTNFIIWAKTHYPARQYALILSSHGDGLAKRLPIHQTISQARILQDDTDNVSCCLSNVLVRQAIEESDVNFDLIGFDASQMGQIETAYEFKELADIIVFSQETGQASGWDYTAILRALANSPDMNGDELAIEIVEGYSSFYEDIFYPQNPSIEQYLTISAIHLGDNINTLSGKVNQVSEMMIDVLNSEDQEIRELLVDAVTTARAQSQELNPYTTPYVYVDLMDFMNKLHDVLKQEAELPLTLVQIEERIEEILALIETVILSEYHGNARPESNGLSITFFRFPEAVDYRTYDSNYKDYNPETSEGSKVRFINDTKWDEFLQTYYVKAGFITEP